MLCKPTFHRKWIKNVKKLKEAIISTKLCMSMCTHAQTQWCKIGKHSERSSFKMVMLICIEILGISDNGNSYIIMIKKKP